MGLGGCHKQAKQARRGPWVARRVAAPARLLLIAATRECRMARFSNFSRRAGNLDCFGLYNLLIFKRWRQIHIFLITLGAKQKMSAG